MMLSSNRVLKSGMVNVDTVNKIVIDGGLQVDTSDEGIDDGSVVKSEKDREKDAQKSATRIVRHAERQAEEIVSNAIKAAAEKQESIRKKAEDDAKKILNDSKEIGYKEGMGKATREGEAIKAQAQQVLDEAYSERKSMQENLEPEIVDMIISITEKLLGNIAEVNPSVIVNLVKQGFAVTSISGNITVYVSADDYDEVFARKDELMALTDGSVKLDITKDLSLSPMDCIIETPMGDIDCSLGQQFETLRANLTCILNNK